jgi:hypothetical protein
MYRRTVEASEVERGAYERLQVLQGSAIPRCYASGTVHPTSTNANTPRPVKPSFLLLEYIEGSSLSAVDAELVPRTLTRRHLHTVHALPRHGVLQADLHTTDIIVMHDSTKHGCSPGEPFSRIFLLDFGLAILRDADDSDEVCEECGTLRASAGGPIHSFIVPGSGTRYSEPEDAGLSALPCEHGPLSRLLQFWSRS